MSISVSFPEGNTIFTVFFFHKSIISESLNCLLRKNYVLVYQHNGIKKLLASVYVLEWRDKISYIFLFWLRPQKLNSTDIATCLQTQDQYYLYMRIQHKLSKQPYYDRNQEEPPLGSWYFFTICIIFNTLGITFQIKRRCTLYSHWVDNIEVLS